MEVGHIRATWGVTHPSCNQPLATWHILIFCCEIFMVW